MLTRVDFIHLLTKILHFICYSTSRGAYMLINIIYSFEKGIKT